MPGERRRGEPARRLHLALPARFDFRRTVLSHGWFALAPFRFEREPFALERPVRVGPGTGVLLRLRGHGRRLQATWQGPGLNAEGRGLLVRLARRMLRLDEDLEPFYRRAAARPRFRWIPRAGAGRLLRAPTVFEDLVKLLCTTHCSWSLTTLIVSNLVDALGEPCRAAGGAHDFPTPAAMAAHGETFYRNEIRAGYRARALAELAEQVASGRLDPERWEDREIPGEDLRLRILAVRGAGPYTAENLMRLLGRYEGLALDAWCRKRFTRLQGLGSAGRRDGGRPRGERRPGGGERTVASDASIARAYASFGSWRGLALWCDLTRDWRPDEGAW